LLLFVIARRSPDVIEGQHRPPVAPGEPAPPFTLPAVDGSGTVSLNDYRGNSPVFLAIFVGLWCPFCRKAIARLSAMETDVANLGVTTLCVVATNPENARLYFKYRPSSLRIGADPDLSTHRAYRLPRPAAGPELMDAIATTKINPNHMFPEPITIAEATATLSRLDGYQENATDRSDIERQWPQLKGQFLIDREGIVRWAHIECAEEGLRGLGKFPTLEDIRSAAQNVH
jgi:peroxiredoxin